MVLGPFRAAEIPLSIWQVLLTRSCLARIPEGMCSGPLIQDLGCEVCSVGPGDGADLRVDVHACEVRRIAECGEDAFPLTEMGQIDIACQAVGEREPEPVVAEDFHVTDVMKRGDHRADSTSAAESGRAAVRMVGRSVHVLVTCAFTRTSCSLREPATRSCR